MAGKHSRSRAVWLAGAGLLIAIVVSAHWGFALAAPPTELGPSVRLDGEGTVFWAPEPDALVYRVYKARRPSTEDWSYGHVCFVGPMVPTQGTDPTLPSIGELFYYLVSKETKSGEGPLGFSSDGFPRPDPLPCLDFDGDLVADPIDNCPYLFNPRQIDTDLTGDGDACDSDDDDDGLTDAEEYVLGTSRTDWDTDGDGLSDGEEVHFWGSDPLSTDTDGDSIDDGGDNCPATVNPSQVDLDSDGFGDECDNCPLLPNGEQPDYDSDDVGDLCDNCPYLWNTNQTDDNYNGVGDACETVALTEILDSGGLECVGSTVVIDAASVGQVAAGHVVGTSTAAEVGFVNGAADE